MGLCYTGALCASNSDLTCHWGRIPSREWRGFTCSEQPQIDSLGRFGRRVGRGTWDAQSIVRPSIHSLSVPLPQPIPLLLCLLLICQYSCFSDAHFRTAPWHPTVWLPFVSLLVEAAFTPTLSCEQFWVMRPITRGIRLGSVRNSLLISFVHQGVGWFC